VGSNLLFAWLLFAEGEAAQGDGGGGMLNPMLLFIALGLLFYFLLIRPQKAEQSRRQQMLSGVQKNDHVVTVGGIYGVVTNVQREADRVTIRVDDSNNVTLRVQLSAIARVVSREAGGEEPSPSKS
jgi:preprotein translocase subunit YajC